MQVIYRLGITVIIIASLLLLALIALNFSWDSASEVALVDSPFIYHFNVPGELQESGSMTESKSPYWWLNSGGVMSILDNAGRTNQGDLSALSKWRLRYKISNSEDTDQGYHPQNIFRLISRNTWQDFSVEAKFKILNDNLSTSHNRNVSNGLLLMLRFQDPNNLYYAGIRVDGTAVIKKKINGEYTTLAQEPVFPGEYDRDSAPNLLPKNTWIGVKSDIKNGLKKEVLITLYLDRDGTGNWQKVLEAKDSPMVMGGKPVYDAGFAGIRTDFMDVSFKDFEVWKL